MSKKYVYMFSEGNAGMRNLLGGKGANLAEMTNLGLPVPYGFTISTEACTEYNEGGKKLTDEMIDQIEVALAKLEEIAGKKLGDPENPLLVSVRSGARASMPGMMDTVLNLGLNDISVEGLAKKTGNTRFAYDSYRRFIMMFADVVIGVSKSKFERKLDEYKESVGAKYDTDLTAEDLKKVTAIFKQIYLDDQGKEFPQNPKEQLLEAAMAVFRSWDNPRAFVYRRMNDIPYSWGTAVNVQMMVFGNMGNTSGTGVAFTRNAATGEKAMLGEYLVNAQGEDVVAGVRTPNPIAKLKEDMPGVYDQFMDIANTLEKHYKDMQDMEFTIEEGKLFFLQTRNGKRTANAALRIAWSYCASTVGCIAQLRAEGYAVYAVEQVEGAVMLDEFRAVPGVKYALVFGNEVEGVSQEAVDRCDGAVEIPQLGTKHSLNVSVSGGVVLWEFFCRIRSKA